jgi:hypothetical protein
MILTATAIKLQPGQNQTFEPLSTLPLANELTGKSMIPIPIPNQIANCVGWLEYCLDLEMQ